MTRNIQNLKQSELTTAWGKNGQAHQNSGIGYSERAETAMLAR
jgi:hypothetical protein